jgi:hypothetical protein
VDLVRTLEIVRLNGKAVRPKRHLTQPLETKTMALGPDDDPADTLNTAMRQDLARKNSHRTKVKNHERNDS